MNSKAKYARLTQRGLLQIQGDDALAFLQAQLSCDVNPLDESRASYGSYSTPQGRMVASFLLWRDAGGYVMHLPRSLCESVRKRLTKFILRSKVSLNDVTKDQVLIGVAGTAAGELLDTIFGVIPEAPLARSTARDATVLRLEPDRFLIAAPVGQETDLLNALAKGADRMDESHWDLLDIRAGIPYILPATQEQFVPQAANLDLIGGVSFDKGCYPGQEIVARLHYRGKLKERMYLAHVASAEAPCPGDKLFGADMGQQATGMIVNAAPAPGGGHDVLAAVHISSVEHGSVHLRANNGPPLAFLDLPYRFR